MSDKYSLEHDEEGNPSIKPVDRVGPFLMTVAADSWDNRTILIDKDYICPVCSEEYNSKLSEGLIVSFPEYAGTYCIKCWAKWISENIPKCIKKEK